MSVAPSASAIGVLKPGTRLQRYEIVSVLGRGSFGVTYAARDRMLNRDVAIKEFLPHAWAGRGDATQVMADVGQANDFVVARDRFLEEARTLVTLDGTPAIVRVLDYLEANGTAYMVMPLLKGETLEVRLSRERLLTESAILRLLGPLLDGLEEVHAAGFLHRDIKPGNIMLDAAGLPTLFDFGAARAVLADRSKALTTIFTPDYSPLEQFMPGRRQGPWTDIYALGATMYHCLTGTPPRSALERMVEGQEMMSLMGPRQAGSMDVLADSITSALRLRAEERPQSIAAWRRQFGTLVARPSVTPEEAILTDPAKTSELNEEASPTDPVRPLRRRSGHLGMVAVATSVGVLIYGLWLASRGNEYPPLSIQPAPFSVPQNNVAEREEDALKLSLYDIERVQAALTGLGFNSEPFDGVFGPETRAMIAAWQTARGKPATGYLTIEQYHALLTEAAGAVAIYDASQKRGKGENTPQ